MHYHSKNRDRSTLDTILFVGFVFLMVYVSAFKPDPKLPYLEIKDTGISVVNDPKIEVPPSDEWLPYTPEAVTPNPQPQK